VDPSTALLSRNLYILGFTSEPSSLVVDSKNSIGEVSSAVPGLYAKVIGCSITTSSTTVIIDGLNHAVNGTDELSPPDPHPWFNAAPLPSRGVPFEDLFSGLYSGPTTLKIQRGSGGFPFSLFEEALETTLFHDSSLQNLEASLILATSFSYAVLGGVYGYTNVSACVVKLPRPCELIHSSYFAVHTHRELKAAGWDPKPTSAISTVPLLKARLNMSPVFTIIGFVASLVFFAAAMAIIGHSPTIVGEKLVGGTLSDLGCKCLIHTSTSDFFVYDIDPSLLFILSMIRRSSLPAALNNGIDDKFAMNEVELRRFGARLMVVLSAEGQLDILSSRPAYDEKSGQTIETGRLLGPTA
jgi:hypothetical protein